jgi:hypothetical protein
MAKDPIDLAGFDAENTGGLLSGFLAEEDEFDRRSLWRLGAWGLAAVTAVIVALMANQFSIGSRRDQVAATDLARQSQQIQTVAKDSQNEARRLASAIDTLNGDRDRFYSRLTVLEHGLDSMTGTIARQNPPTAAPPQAASAPPAVSSATSSPATSSPGAPASASVEPSSMAQNPSPAPVTSPVATIPAKAAEKPVTNANAETTAGTASSVNPGAPTAPATSPTASLTAPKSIMAPPDSAASKPIEPEKPASPIVAAPIPEAFASTSTEPDTIETLPKVAVQRTEFGVDVGSANSLGGLRALWRGLLKSRANAPLAELRPIIVVKESSTGLGMQLRLVAGPLSDAAAAAKICAAMIENQRPCETTVFDGQRLAMKADEPPASTKPAATTKPAVPRRSSTAKKVTEEPPPTPEPATLSSFFSRL